MRYNTGTVKCLHYDPNIRAFQLHFIRFFQQIKARERVRPENNHAKFFINVLAEPAELVAEYLVPNIRAIPARGSMKPTYIRFLTGIKAYTKIFSRVALGARKNRYVTED